MPSQGFLQALNDFRGDRDAGLDSIYNMDETCIMYQTIPEYIIVPKMTKNCTIKTSKYEKDKVTVILLIRADGQKQGWKTHDPSIEGKFFKPMILP